MVLLVLAWIIVPKKRRMQMVFRMTTVSGRSNDRDGICDPGSKQWSSQ
jgi:hypothetical protein